MNESIIKEIKTIYSGRAGKPYTPAVTPEIEKTPEKKVNKNNKKNTFFNGVMKKLDTLGK